MKEHAIRVAAYMGWAINPMSGWWARPGGDGEGYFEKQVLEHFLDLNNLMAVWEKMDDEDDGRDFSFWRPQHHKEWTFRCEDGHEAKHYARCCETIQEAALISTSKVIEAMESSDG